MYNQKNFQRKKKQRLKNSLQHFFLFLIFILIISNSYLYIKSETVHSVISDSPPLNLELQPLIVKGPYIREGTGEFAHPNVFQMGNQNGDNYFNTLNLITITHKQYRKLGEISNKDIKESNQPKESLHKEQQQAIDMNTIHKTVYLTFDDGPNQVSEQILSILSLYNAKATFFLIDGNIRKYPEAVRKMVESGHSVGSHSVSHRVGTFYQSSETVLAEMNQVRSTIKEITGTDSMLIRTPYGSKPYMTDTYKQVVMANGFLMWDWNVDSKDWYFQDHRFVENIIAQIENKRNSPEPFVILLHEREETAAHLPALLEYLKNQNCTLSAIDGTMTPVAFK